MEKVSSYGTVPQYGSWQNRRSNAATAKALTLVTQAKNVAGDWLNILTIDVKWWCLINNHIVEHHLQTKHQIDGTLQSFVAALRAIMQPNYYIRKTYAHLEIFQFREFQSRLSVRLYIVLITSKLLLIVLQGAELEKEERKNQNYAVHWYHFTMQSQRVQRNG